MRNLQFRVLYWQFLFRVVDLELLSASALGDANRLLGQFAALLVYFSAALLFGGLISGIAGMPGARRMAATWGAEQFLISTTMLVVGLFGVLSWESMFPDRRDVMVLVPLPIRPRMIFMAKAMAVMAALTLTVAALHGLASLIWPILLAPAGGGVLGAVRSFAGYWITVFAAGGFVFGSLLCAQGLAAILPRQKFLRLSGVLQLCAFCLLLCAYFLEPTILTPQALTSPRGEHLVAWLPPYWFWGLFQILSGATHPAFAPLAWRAAAGLAVVVAGAGATFLFSYLRTLRKIVEEPDIAAGARGSFWLPRFGDAPLTAQVHFSLRSLWRSRQHRLILSFFLGIAFAVLVLYVKAPIYRTQMVAGAEFWHQVNTPLLASSVVMMWFAVIGIRVAFAMPTDLRANWIFRVADVRGVPECLKATRRSIFAFAVVPVWMIWAAVLLRLWPWRPAMEHLVLLGLVGAILTEACLRGFHKIPFTCSYLPGKSNVYWLFFAYAFLSIFLLNSILSLERSALQHTTQYAIAVLAMSVAAIAARWRVEALSRSEAATLRFEEIEPPQLLELGLYRDGVIAITRYEP
jgi:hypothetical protein